MESRAPGTDSATYAAYYPPKEEKTYMNRPRLFLTLGAAFTAFALIGAGCGDDDDDAADDAQDLAGSLEQFNNAFNGTDNLVQASDDVKGDMRDNCDELRDGVDSDDLDGFCESLNDAIDDDDQAAFGTLKTAWPAIETQVRNQITGDIVDAANDGDDRKANNDDDDGLDDALDGDDDDDPDTDGDGTSDDDEDDNPITQ
jgi:outer membrane murein-binding lipoprotein Lpp